MNMNTIYKTPTDSGWNSHWVHVQAVLVVIVWQKLALPQTVLQTIALLEGRNNTQNNFPARDKNMKLYLEMFCTICFILEQSQAVNV